MSENYETEKCVICGIDTGVPTHRHIDFRNNYVEGSGQLCMNCYGGTPPIPPVLDKVYPHSLGDATDKKYIYDSKDNSIQFGKYKFASDELRAIADAMDKAFKEEVEPKSVNLPKEIEGGSEPFKYPKMRADMSTCKYK